MTPMREFFSEIIDYAGLFPPAGQEMTTAVREYAKHLAGPDRDLIGRFVLPVTRLDEFGAAARPNLSGDGKSWRVSAIVAADPDAARTAVDTFNSTNAGVKCDSVELPVASYDDIARASAAFGEDMSVFLEVSPHADSIALLREIAETTASAKLRTGGVTASAIPSSDQVFRFLDVCIAEGVPFKATAGLHHAIRGEYSLTYEQGSPRAVMFGYLNVFLAAAFRAAGSSESAVLGILEETDPNAFRTDDRGVWWHDHVVVHEQLATVRKTVALSFGSCSFTEPVAEARALKLL